MNLSIHRLKPEEPQLARLIAGWYLAEWHLPVAQTTERLQQIISDPVQLQLLLFDGDEPVATGGIYHHVGLLDRVPRLRIYRHWLALLYTMPEHRQKGYGTALCRALVNATADLGMSELHLFTDTAVAFYSKLGWTQKELLQIGGRSVMIMELLVKKETPLTR